MEFVETLDNFDDVYVNLTNIYSKEINYRLKNPYFKYERALSFYTLFLIVIGTLSNLVSFVIMNRKHMKKYACMKYLSALAISDILILYQWNLNTFFKYNFARPPFYLDLEELSLVTCRLIAFGAFFCLQLSAWMLSLVSFDRLMLVYSTRWKHYMHKPVRIRLVIAATAGILFILNVHLLFLNGYVVHTDMSVVLARPPSLESKNVVSGHVILAKQNSTKFIYIPKSEVICYRSLADHKYIFPKWEKAHLFLYSILPFSIMLISNSLIIYNVKYGQKVESKVKSSLKRKRRMTCMLCLVTFSFVLLTLPSVIVHTFFREILKKKTYRRFVNLIVNNLLHTSHAINFFLYVFSAPNFRAEILTIFSQRRFFNTNSSSKSVRRNGGGTVFRKQLKKTSEADAVVDAVGANALRKRISNTAETVNSSSESSSSKAANEIKSQIVETTANGHATTSHFIEEQQQLMIAETPSTASKQIRFTLEEH